MHKEKIYKKNLDKIFKCNLFYLKIYTLHWLFILRNIVIFIVAHFAVGGRGQAHLPIVMGVGRRWAQDRQISRYSTTATSKTAQDCRGF